MYFMALISYSISFSFINDVIALVPFKYKHFFYFS